MFAWMDLPVWLSTSFCFPFSVLIIVPSIISFLIKFQFFSKFINFFLISTVVLFHRSYSPVFAIMSVFSLMILMLKLMFNFYFLINHILIFRHYIISCLFYTLAICLIIVSFLSPKIWSFIIFSLSFSYLWNRKLHLSYKFQNFHLYIQYNFLYNLYNF